MENKERKESSRANNNFQELSTTKPILIQENTSSVSNETPKDVFIKDAIKMKGKAQEALEVANEDYDPQTKGPKKSYPKVIVDHQCIPLKIENLYTGQKFSMESRGEKIPLPGKEQNLESQVDVSETELPETTASDLTRDLLVKRQNNFQAELLENSNQIQNSLTQHQSDRFFYTQFSLNHSIQTQNQSGSLLQNSSPLQENSPLEQALPQLTSASTGAIPKHNKELMVLQSNSQIYEVSRKLREKYLNYAEEPEQSEVEPNLENPEEVSSTGLTMHCENTSNSVSWYQMAEAEQLHNCTSHVHSNSQPDQFHNPGVTDYTYENPSSIQSSVQLDQTQNPLPSGTMPKYSRNQQKRQMVRFQEDLHRSDHSQNYRFSRSIGGRRHRRNYKQFPVNVQGSMQPRAMEAVHRGPLRAFPNRQYLTRIIMNSRYSLIPEEDNQESRKNLQGNHYTAQRIRTPNHVQRGRRESRLKGRGRIRYPRASGYRQNSEEYLEQKSHFEFCSIHGMEITEVEAAARNKSNRAQFVAAVTTMSEEGLTVPNGKSSSNSAGSPADLQEYPELPSIAGTM